MKHFDIIRSTTAPRHRMTRLQKSILAVIIVAVLAFTGVAVWMQKANSSSAYIQSDKYQALFLTNSQVYFGKLQRLNDGSYRITDVFYIKSDPAATEDAAKQATSGTAQQANQQPTLIKLGDELHGPTDEIIVKDNQVLFWENLKTDGKVTKAIDAYKKK